MSIGSILSFSFRLVDLDKDLKQAIGTAWLGGPAISYERRDARVQGW